MIPILHTLINNDILDNNQATNYPVKYYWIDNSTNLIYTMLYSRIQKVDNTIQNTPSPSIFRISEISTSFICNYLEISTHFSKCNIDIPLLKAKPHAH